MIGGSGNGEQIVANKVTGVRSALVWSDDTAALAREHNDAKVVSVGGRMHTLEEMTRFIGIFLRAPFSGDERQSRRQGEPLQRRTKLPLPIHHLLTPLAA